MLIIAIPKSASSSLLRTLSDIYGIPEKNEKYASANVPKNEFKILWKYHSTMREISAEQLSEWVSSESFYKLHVLPTKNNQELLQNYQKVILLRNPDDIVLSYRRTQNAGLSSERIEFKECKSENDWLVNAKKIGLLDDLDKFYNKWLEHSGDKLIIYYEQFIVSPEQVINKIADYWNLPSIYQPVKIAREKYTRVSTLEKLHNKTSRIIKNIKIKYGQN